MGSQYRWRSHAATGRLVVDGGGVARLTLAGPLTESVCVGLTAFAGPRQVRAWVVDMRAALIVLTLEEMGSLIDRLPPGNALAQPGALVVSGELLATMYQHARSVAQKGVLRAAFTEISPALRWARRQARLAA